MQQYHDLLQRILDEGEEINDERTGVGTIATFGEFLKFDLSKGFPAITTKKLAWKAVVSELLWFLRGSSNVHELRAILHGEENRFNLEKKTIWDENYENQAKALGYTDGEMGDIYGVQWRGFGKCEYSVLENECELVTYGRSKGIDQISQVLDEAKRNPSSRRLLVNAWNPKVVWGDENDNFKSHMAALPPCHYGFQLNIINGRLDMSWNQRSADCGVGVPFNVASYALLQHSFARILKLEVGKLNGFLGNAHIYKNHVDAIKEQLTREHFPAPELWINPDLKTLEDFENATVDDFKLIGYNHHESIKMQMAI